MQLPDYYPDAVSAGHQSSACFSQPKELQRYHLSILLLMLLGNHFGGSGYTRLEAEPRESGTRARAGDAGPRQTQLKPVPSQRRGAPTKGRRAVPCSTEQFLGARTPPVSLQPVFPAAACPRGEPEHGTRFCCSPRRTRSRERRRQVSNRPAWASALMAELPARRTEPFSGGDGAAPSELWAGGRGRQRAACDAGGTGSPRAQGPGPTCCLTRR